MKKSPLNPVIVIVLTISILISGFTKKNNDVAPSDPSGTITTNLGFDFAGGITLVNDANGYIRLSLSSSLNIYGEEESNTLPGSATVASVGAVSGLGAITSHPSSGYSSTAAAVAGNGYVMELINVAPVPQYYRIYIESFQSSPSGGVLGATIKYQGPF